jgi:two-component sensor histidine kinase
VECGDLTLGLKTVIPCGLIVNELVSNALKHAFSDGRTGVIDIKFTHESPDHLILTVRDNGVGLPEGLDPEQNDSLGLILVNSLATSLTERFRWNRTAVHALLFVFP